MLQRLFRNDRDAIMRNIDLVARIEPTAQCKKDAVQGNGHPVRSNRQAIKNNKDGMCNKTHSAMNNKDCGLSIKDSA